MARYIRTGIVIALLATAAVMVPRIVSSREDIRDVTLVVRNMTYYVDGNTEPNPALRFTAGEQVRLTLRNEDPGMSHDFNIMAWGVSTKVLEGKGRHSVVFRVPSRGAISTTYTCTPHSAMMSGTVIID